MSRWHTKSWRTDLVGAGNGAVKEPKYRFSSHSQNEMKHLHPYLQKALNRLLLVHDFKVLQGGRTWKEQHEAYFLGRSRLAPPKGKHLIQQDGFAYAADIVPFINGRAVATDKANFGPVQMAQFAYFLGLFKAIADGSLIFAEYRIRLGINWDEDAEILSDQDFDDWFHVELVKGE